MQEVNWGNFRAKFNGKEQKTFEWLCSLLFYDEFGKHYGIFRYKNQPGIETEPILVNGEWIGFQAKFYEAKISDNVVEIKKSIQIAKTDNPNLQRVLFYLNQEFSENPKPGKKEPAYQIDIETFATEQGVRIEWKVPSHFEAQLALDRNKHIAQHFFSLDRSIVDFIKELRQFTERFFVPIHSAMELHGQAIKLDRSSLVQEIKTAFEQSPILILSGEAGVGKTAVVKELYEAVKDETPFFAFRATAFQASHINQVFRQYGDFTFSDFLDEHEAIPEKYVVIDSAERLFDLDSPDVFQEFLSGLVAHHWRIIFTIRYSFLDNLKRHFLDVYRLSSQLRLIAKSDLEELRQLSKAYQFPLPQNTRLLEFITCPLYLSEYLRFYQDFPTTTTLSDFKDILWAKIVQGSRMKNNAQKKRETCFLNIVRERVTTGKFFVEAAGCEDDILVQLETDEIITRDSNTGSYFITHDIYEEWGLEKIIERAFQEVQEYREFFVSIGASLPMRRVFRAWLSEKLLTAADEVKALIAYAVTDRAVEKHWKDEVQVSVLLSEYSEVFFQLFAAELLANNQMLLVRVLFLLRTACKELDEDLLRELGVSEIQPQMTITPFTKPKGFGWSSTIHFIHAHLAELGLQQMAYVLPLLEDWVTKNKSGDTVKQASQIALFYYEEVMANGGFGYSSRDNRREQLFKVILQGASEIKDELNVIFEEVIREKQTNHDDKHYALVKTVLTSPTDSFEVARNLPEQVLRLADLFWSYVEPTDLPPYASRGIGLEEDFGIGADHLEYYPASALQTPLFFLLRNFPMETMNFILAFTNKTTEAYAKSDLDGSIEEVDVFLGDKVVKQYISNRLWCMYRGTQTAPDLLESIHMALEKWLLNYANMVSPQHLASVCRYLISKSTSASITAAVASVVLANPEKLFTIAAILFQTKQFFFSDTNRWLLDQSARNHYAIGYGLNAKHKVHEDERIQTCDDPHRQLSLEHIAFKYQIVRSEEDNNEETERKQRVLWSIFDKHYQELPDKANETEHDKTWQLYLTRMDARKMKAQVEEKDGGVQVTFHPEVDPELQAYSETSKQRSSESMKYLALQLWAKSRFEMGEDYKRHTQYEHDPQRVIAETKDILENLQNDTVKDFSLFNASTPAYTCSVLIRDYFDKLSADEREFCKSIVAGFACVPFVRDWYQYQASDGTEPAIISLPGLLKSFPGDKENILIFLLLALFNPSEEIAKFATTGILQGLWDNNFANAHALFLGYLSLKKKYDDARKEIRTENYKNGIQRVSEAQVAEKFGNQYDEDLQRIVANKIAYDDLHDLEQLDLATLTKAFELLPLSIEHEDHKKFLETLFTVFSKQLFQYTQKATDHALCRRFLKKLAQFLLHSPKNEIRSYLRPFIDNLNSSEGLADFFFELVSAEDTLQQYEAFWCIWDAFYEKIVELARNSCDYYHTKTILHNYLLAWPYWREGITEWHSLKEREKSFFSKVANDMGHCATVLYSLAKVLNDIGSNYLDDGITWLSAILEKNENLLSEDLEMNTIYHIESLMRKYTSKHRKRLRSNARAKKQIIIILNFLVERGSTTGYWLRDDIL
jgi:hypothetical protein